MCAKVRIRIQQRVALTRDAFKATLELENGESAKLTAIRVVLHIDNHQTKASALQHFAIGEHTALENRRIILIRKKSIAFICICCDGRLLFGTILIITLLAIFGSFSTMGI